MSRIGEVIETLRATIESRRGADPKVSWSARLLSDQTLASKKLAEEGLEAALAAVKQDKSALISESADLLYHWLAVLVGAGVDLDDVAKTLEERQGRSGIDEKASRRS